jgi:hypothetical protein
MTCDDPEKIEEAKRLAAGPLGEKLAKYPLLFSKAAFFGERPAKHKSTYVRNGTVTLVDFGTGPIAITCAHVISDYRKLLKTNERALFQLGNVEFDPLSQLIAEDKRLDLATIRLTPTQAKAITREGEIGACFFQPVSWPPPSLSEGDFIAFGGFPGRWRERRAFDKLVFPSFSSGACRVASVAEDRFACQFERDYWVTAFDIDKREDLEDLGGLSGGPAFIHRGLYWDFAGVIYEFSNDYDIMLLRPAHLFNPDGSIIGPSV